MRSIVLSTIERKKQKIKIKHTISTQSTCLWSGIEQERSSRGRAGAAASGQVSQLEAIAPGSPLTFSRVSPGLQLSLIFPQHLSPDPSNGWQTLQLFLSGA